MLPEEIQRDLDAAKQLAEQSKEDINKFINTLNAHALKLVTDIYADDLLTMESNGFRKINELLSRHLTKLGVDIDNAIFNNQVQI